MASESDLPAYFTGFSLQFLVAGANRLSKRRTIVIQISRRLSLDFRHRIPETQIL
jgi:hypothetical protein